MKALIFLLCFFSITTFAQPPVGKVMHYTQKEGLSFGIINSITQDNKSFMWFATAYGLNRFDGATFKVFRFDPSTEKGLPGNYVQKVFKDSSGDLWVSSRNGLFRFDPETEHFNRYKLISDPQKKADVTCISENKEGNLWISMSGTGFSYLDKKRKEVRNYNTNNLKGLSSNSILNIYEDTVGFLWVGTRDAGINVFHINKGKIGERVIFTDPISTSARVNCIYSDKEANIWIGTSGGLWLYERKSNKFHFIYGQNYRLRSNFFLSVIQDSQRQLYVGLQDGGLYVLDLNRFKVSNPSEFVFEQVTNENGLHITPRSVQDLYIDKDKNLWAGTYGDGVYMVNKTTEKFRLFHKKTTDRYGESYIRYYGICMDKEGYLWLGTDGDGIYKSTKEGKILKHYTADGKKNSLTDHAILYAFKDSKNNLWFGTYAKGLLLYDPRSDGFISFQHHAADPSSLGGNDVRVIHEDKQANIWVGMNGGGLSLFNPLTRKFKNFNTSNSKISSNDVRALEHDQDNNLWIGTYGGGLNYLDIRQQMFRPLLLKTKREPGTSSDIILSLYLDQQRHLWIGTEGDGLLLYTIPQKTLTRFNEKKGLANNTVYAIKAERSGKIWLSTNNGLSTIDLRNHKIYNYEESNGLQGGQFNPGSAIYDAKDDLMCFGGTEGWNLFYPSLIKPSSYLPEVRITGLQLYGKEEGDNGDIKNVSESKQIVLDASQPVFSIQYMALNYAYPKSAQFAYKLEGLDKDWNYVKYQKSATYRYLSPGIYTFKVKASNQDGTWNDSYAKVDIRILPPWYKSWWAYCVYSIFTGMAVYAFIHYKSNQAKLKYKIKIAHIEAEKEKEVHENKLSFFTNISHEFRSPLTLIINPVKEMLHDQEKSPDLSSLNIVYRNAKRLLSLVDQLLLFSKAETQADQLKVSEMNLVELGQEVFLCFTYQAAKKNVQYEFICSQDDICIFGDREKIEISLFNLLSNALRHTPEGGRVALSIRDEERYVDVVVTDTGTGIGAEVGEKIFDRFYKVQNRRNYAKGGFGIGLYLVKNFVESHGGKVSYTSKVDEGTDFNLRFLKGKGHFRQELFFEEQLESSVILEELREEFEEEGMPLSQPDLQEDLASDKKTMLLIDDNMQIRQYIKQIFNYKFDLLEADNGELGLEMIGRYLPDIVISDVLMQGLNGVELCKKVKGDPAFNHIPFILLTASTSSEIKLKGIECGADDYISKPFEKEILVARVEGLLKSRNNLQQYFYNEITLKADNLKISSEYKEFLDRCIAVVEKHMTDPNFGITTLAEETGMSRSNLYVKIKSISGQSANSFIRFIRLRKAAEFFISTEYTVQETTFRVGIKDARYFREQFHKLFGMNPSDYIKKYRKTFNAKYSLHKSMIKPKDNK